MQTNSNPMKDGGKIIKQAYSSLLKNNFVPQQPNKKSLEGMWAYKESLTTKNSIKFQTIERIPKKYGNNKKKKNRSSSFEIFSIIFVVKVEKKMTRQDNSDL